MTSIRQVRTYESMIEQNMKKRLLKAWQQFDMLSARMSSASPDTRLANQKIYLDSLQDKLCQAADQKYRNRSHCFDLLLTRLNGLSPTAKLVGGYGYMEREDGVTIKSVSDVKEQDHFTVTLWDGTIEGIVTQIEQQSNIDDKIHT